jgi:hypothetical protein
MVNPAENYSAFAVNYLLSGMKIAICYNVVILVDHVPLLILSTLVKCMMYPSDTVSSIAF